MKKLMIALLASALGTGIAAAQNWPFGSSGTATEPTQTEAKGVGPQDSVGTSGSSPTKELMTGIDNERDPERAPRTARQEPESNSVPGTKGATHNGASATSGMPQKGTSSGASESGGSGR